MTFRMMMLASVSLAALSAQAHAQSSSSPTANAEQRASFEGRETEETGVRIGMFTLRPELTIDNEYNDNNLLEEDDTNSTFVFRFQPSATLSSNWSRHALRFSAGAEQGVFTDSSDDNYTDYFFNGRGQLDVSRDATVTVGAGFNNLHEQRGTDDVPVIADAPVDFTSITATINANYDPGILRLSPFFGFTNLDFDDTNVTEEDDRDRNELRGGAEVGYEFRRGYEAFVRGELIGVDYDDSTLDGGPNRDSAGYNARGGVQFSVSRLVTARVGAGYVSRDFDDDALEDADGFVIDLSAQWTPTPRTTVTVLGTRDVQETTVIDGTDAASSTIEIFGRLEVDHAVRRNLVVSAFASAANEEFEGIDRDDDNFQVGVGAEWLITSNFSASARYSYENESSSEPGNDYQVNTFSIGLTGRY